MYEDSELIPFKGFESVHGSVAQWIRRLPTEQEIVGSSPALVKPFSVIFDSPVTRSIKVRTVGVWTFCFYSKFLVLGLFIRIKLLGLFGLSAIRSVR